MLYLFLSTIWGACTLLLIHISTTLILSFLLHFNAPWFAARTCFNFLLHVGKRSQTLCFWSLIPTRVLSIQVLQCYYSWDIGSAYKPRERDEMPRSEPCPTHHHTELEACCKVSTSSAHSVTMLQVSVGDIKVNVSDVIIAFYDCQWKVWNTLIVGKFRSSCCALGGLPRPTRMQLFLKNFI